MERFTEKDIMCLGCGCYHAFDMSLKQVACPKEHPHDYPRKIVDKKGVIIEDDTDEIEQMNYDAQQNDDVAPERRKAY